MLRLTEDGRRALIDHGIRKVVDLRAEWEVARFPYPFDRDDLPGVAVQNVPLISNANWDAAARNEGKEHPYVLIAKLSGPNIVAVLKSILDADGGVVVHCHEGRERTGLIAALLLELAGVADDLVAEDWQASQPDVLKATDILPVLAYMRERNGSVQEFLFAEGLSHSEVDALKSRLSA